MISFYLKNIRQNLHLEGKGLIKLLLLFIFGFLDMYVQIIIIFDISTQGNGDGGFKLVTSSL
jgi:hypothetical protein